MNWVEYTKVRIFSCEQIDRSADRLESIAKGFASMAGDQNPRGIRIRKETLRETYRRFDSLGYLLSGYFEFA